jgi:hypothetical protein
MDGLRVSVFAVALAVGSCLATPAAAQWMWRDAKGQMHASDLPPPREVPEKDIVQRPRGLRSAPPAPAPASASAPNAAASAPAKPAVDPGLEARRKRDEEEQLAQRKKEEERVAALRAENCARARAHLRSLEDGMRLARVNEKGEREVLDDEQRAAETQRARNVIATECR